jgi:lysophospholipase L1-like esterase
LEGDGMKKIFTSLCLCSIFLTSCQLAPSTNLAVNQERETELTLRNEIPNDFIPKSYTIVSVGDSLTEGVGDSSNNGGYIPYLKEKLEEEKGIKDAVFYNFGVSGNKTSQILRRLQTSDVKDRIKEADMVIMTTGGNDVMKVVKENLLDLEVGDFEGAKNRYKKELKSVIETVREENPDTLICLIGIYNPFYQYLSDIEEMDMIMEDWNQTSQLVLEKFDNTYFADISDLFKEGEENLLYTDYFHPNDKGYELIAKRVFSVLQNQAINTLTNRKYAVNTKDGL